jgi:alpha-L-fucosidase
VLYDATLDWNGPRFEPDFPACLQYLRDSIELLCTRYGPIGGFWSDGHWTKPKTDLRMTGSTPSFASTSPKR